MFILNTVKILEVNIMAVRTSKKKITFDPHGGREWPDTSDPTWWREWTDDIIGIGSGD